MQACRWQYEIREKDSECGYLEMQEDERGTYIMNSKDLNLLDHIPSLIKAGVCSFKVEGRMKSEYYLATVINAYRRALDAYYEIGASYKDDPTFQTELIKTAHRDFTTAYFLGENKRTVNYSDSQSKGTHKFIATVIGTGDGYIEVEMRNRFKTGDRLEVLSPSANLNKIITVSEMWDDTGVPITDAKLVQQKIKIKTDFNLNVGDILRSEILK